MLRRLAPHQWRPCFFTRQNSEISGIGRTRQIGHNNLVDTCQQWRVRLQTAQKKVKRALVTTCFDQHTFAVIQHMTGNTQAPRKLPDKRPKPDALDKTPDPYGFG